MTKEQKIEGLLMQLKHGYCEETMTKIHLIRADIKAEKEAKQHKTEVHLENIVILEK